MKIRSVRLGRGLAAAGVTVGLVLGAAACNDDSDSSSSSAAGGASSAAASSAPSAAQTGKAGGGASGGSATGGGANGGSATGGSTGGAKPSGAAAGGSRCHTDELKADVQLQPMFPNQAMVMLVNKGSRSCTVDGYLGYGGTLSDGSAVNLTTNRVAHPGAPVQVTLKPGTTAFSGLKWSSCDKADTSCHVLGGLVITPPDETTQLTANVLDDNGQTLPQLLVSSAGLTVGSLQPSNEGVVFGN